MSQYKTTIQKPLSAELKLIDSDGDEVYITSQHLRNLNLVEMQPLVDRVKGTLAYLLKGDTTNISAVAENLMTDTFMQVLMMALREEDPKQIYERITSSEYSERRIEKAIDALTGAL